MATEDEIRRSRAIRDLWTNPLMEEVLEATFGDLFRQWMATKPNESNDREWIYSTALALSKLTDRFTQEIAVVEEEEARERLEKERGDGETVPA